ncbi:MAG: hypothetical protein ABIP36_01255 [Acidimicrobiales bacterium]
MNSTTSSRSVILIAVLLLAACGDASGEVRTPEGTSSTVGADAPVVHRGHVTVLEEPGSPAHVCTGTFEQSAAPHCEGVPIDGWDWDAVEGEEQYGSTSWGDFEIDVVAAGGRLSLVDARALTAALGPAPAPFPQEPDFRSPCPEPPGGWASTVDESKLAFENFSALGPLLDAMPDRSAVWSDPSSSEDPELKVTNVRVVANRAQHEAEISAVWGGPICVIEGGRPKAELLEILEQVSTEVSATTRGLDELAGRAEIFVLLADPAQQADLDARYGEGTVVLHPLLVPVEASTTAAT